MRTFTDSELAELEGLLERWVLGFAQCSTDQLVAAEAIEDWMLRHCGSKSVELTLTRMARKLLIAERVNQEQRLRLQEANRHIEELEEELEEQQEYDQ
jgi:hypothetical protein